VLMIRCLVAGEAIGGNVKGSTECNEVCAALSSASIRCQDDDDCQHELVWKIPQPIPSVRESVSLSIGLACCDWVEQTLTNVCENFNSTLLADFLTLHTTAEVEGNCRESADGVDCILPVVTEAGGSSSSAAAALTASWGALAAGFALLLTAAAGGAHV